MKKHNPTQEPEVTETPTPVADAIETSAEGKPVVNGAVQVSTNDSGGHKKLGRPKKDGSARQAKLAEMDAKRAANDGYLPLGRPKVNGSARQLEMLAKEEAKANGTARGKGRPKMTEEDKAIAKEKREIARQKWLEGQAAKAAGVQVSEAIVE